MRKRIAVLSLVVFLAGLGSSVYASDWGKAGKAFAIIEGLRVLSGGKVDVIGSITGINQDKGDIRYYTYNNGNRNKNHRYSNQVWVPQVIYKKKYVPRHQEYSEKHGTVIVVEGHYVEYPVEVGGYWANVYDHRPSHYYSKKYHRHH